MMGDWQIMGNPCIGEESDKTFNAQSTYILPVVGTKDKLWPIDGIKQIFLIQDISGFH